MRLIDASKLIEICDKGWRLGSAINTKIYHTVDASDIRSQPTVKAIPINWIKNWCVKNYPTYPRIITEELLKKTETWRMIEDWEKENDKDSE